MSMLSGFHPLLVFITLYADDIIKFKKDISMQSF